MIAPQRQIENRNHRRVTPAMRTARRAVVAGFAEEGRVDAAPLVKAWKAWLVVGWMLVAAAAYVTKMAGLWN